MSNEMKATILVTKVDDDKVDVTITFDPAPTEEEILKLPTAAGAAGSMVAAFAELYYLKYGSNPVNKLSVPQINREYTHEQLTASAVLRINKHVMDIIKSETMTEEESSDVPRIVH